MSILKDSGIGQYYLARSRKMYIKLAIILLCIILVLSLLLWAIFAILSLPKKSTIKLNFDGQIELSYGDELDLSVLQFSYTSLGGSDIIDNKPSVKVIEYDSEKIGTQQVIIKYRGKEFTVTVNILPKIIGVPQVGLKDGLLKWNAIDGASSYDIYLGSNQDKLAKIDNSVNNQFDLSQLDVVGEYYVAVKAVPSSEKYSSGEISSSVYFNKIPKITSVSYQDGNIKWNTLSGVNSYTIYVNGKLLANVTESTFNYELIVGDNRIEIAPLAEKDYYVVVKSDALTIKKLSNLTNLELKDSLLTWDAVDFTDRYDIYINGALKYTQEENSLSESVLPQGLNTVKIVCTSLKENVMDSTGYEFKMVSNVTPLLEGGILSWYNFGESYLYDVVVNDNVIIDNTAEISINLHQYITVPDEYSVYIKLVSAEEIFVDYTTTISVTKLTTPTITYDKNTEQLSVDIAENTVKYMLDGKEFDGNISSITQSGEHTITAQYIAQTNQLDSDVSSIVLNKLPKPTVTISNNFALVEGGYSNVQFYANGSLLKNNLASITEAGTYQIAAKLTAVNDNDISSLLSDEITVEKLAKPVLTYTDEGKINVDTGSNVEFYYGDGIKFDGDLSKLDMGKYDIYAKSVGDGSSTLSSEISDTLKIYNKIASGNVNWQYGKYSLNVPSNIKFTADVTIEYFGEDYEFKSSKHSLTHEGYSVTMLLNQAGHEANQVKITATVSVDGYLYKFIQEFNKQ